MDIVGLAGLVFGGVSAGLSLFQHFRKTTRLDKLKDLKEGLEQGTSFLGRCPRRMNLFSGLRTAN